MEIGDLVKYKVPDFAQHQENAGKNRPIGIIVNFKNTFSIGGGGAYPSSETHAIISWSNSDGPWITNERVEDLEKACKSVT